jgi:hypothetical protein
MRIYTCNTIMSVDDAPPGLFLLEESGELICKSEYITNNGCKCIIVSSGENYCGSGDELCRPIIIQ